jgi:hypothetical protein
MVFGEMVIGKGYLQKAIGGKGTAAGQMHPSIIDADLPAQF